jgi:hypothetical protein
MCAKFEELNARHTGTMGKDWLESLRRDDEWLGTKGGKDA